MSRYRRSRLSSRKRSGRLSLPRFPVKWSRATGHHAGPHGLSLESALSGTSFWVAVGISLALIYLPVTTGISIPFKLLAVWVHEMGHGLSAILAGGEFLKLEVTPRFGGLATTRPVSDFAHALSCAGGLLGPSAAGLLILLLSRNWHASGLALLLLAIALLASAFYWAANDFSRLSIVAVASMITCLAIVPALWLREIAAQLIGIQFCVNSLSDFDYMFSETATVNGKTYMSDTAQIAAEVGGSYLLWAMMIAIQSVLFLWLAFNFSLTASSRKVWV